MMIEYIFDKYDNPCLNIIHGQSIWHASWPTEFLQPYILPFLKKIVSQIIDMNVTVVVHKSS